MLLDVENLTCGCSADRIATALRATDPSATVSVLKDTRQVRIEGALTEAQAVSALATLGYPASRAAPHSGPGSDCCGGCS